MAYVAGGGLGGYASWVISSVDEGSDATIT
jgi:hypothetical protein